MAVQEVRVFNEIGEPFSAAEIINISVGPESYLPSHPVEDGTVISDTIIRNNTRINLTVILNPESYQDTYNIIKQLNTDSIACTIQTKADTYENMYLENYPHQEDASKFDTIAMTLSFVQQRFVKVFTQSLTGDDVDNSGDVSTVDRGDQIPVDSGDPVELG